MEQQHNITMPLIGDPAPAFEADSTQGKIRFPEQFRGKWVILFSHPSDFTAICTSEFVLFGAMQEEFERYNCQLVGLSVGTVPSHIAWLKNIEERIEYRGHSGVKIRFPLVADMTMEVARRYGMIHPATRTSAAVRAVFFIDPHAYVRAIVYYPMQLGRNFDELKRILLGLQVVDKYGVALPADWQPGDDIVVPQPATAEAAARAEAEEGMRCCDWYFCTRPLSLDEKKVETTVTA